MFRACTRYEDRFFLSFPISSPPPRKIRYTRTFYHLVCIAPICGDISTEALRLSNTAPQQVQIKGKSKAKYDVSETKRDDGDYHLPNSASRYTRGPSMEPGPSSQSRRDPNTSTSAHHPPNRNAQRLHALVRLMDNFVRQEAQSESLARHMFSGSRIISLLYAK